MPSLDPFTIAISLIYLSFAIDLLGFPVPSEASTYQLFFPQKENHEGLSINLLTKVQQWPMLIKMMVLLIPTMIGIIAYLLPLLVVIVDPLQRFLGIFAPSDNLILASIGVGVAILGRVLSIRSAIQIRKQKEGSTNKSLKTGSFFEVSRNPILLGLHLTFLGLLLIYPVWAMLFGGLVYFANMHFKVILEEHYLKEKFGHSFIQYCQNTKRYL